MDPSEPLNHEESLMALKARIAKEGSEAVFSPLTEKFVLNNPHLYTVEMQPDPEQASRDESAENEILESQSKYARRRFSSVSTCHAGATFGAGSPDPPEALRTIPSLSLHDIPKMPIRVPTEVTRSPF
ncbi:hypothetical protein ACJRO7_020247 [Eucalyptus globulus]|uniref:Uncharacterized protein n=1 Tax=Eucalyptus globulus TaxID=34317 RepID=A0ABD3KHN9_EUCGL